MTTKQSTTPIGPDTVMLGGSIERRDRTGWIHMQIFVPTGASTEQIAAAVQTWRDTYEPAMAALYAEAGYTAAPLDGQAPAQLAEPADPGDTRITFGQHQGKTIREIWNIDTGYVEEFLAQRAYKPEIREAAAAFVASLGPAASDQAAAPEQAAGDQAAPEQPTDDGSLPY